MYHSASMETCLETPCVPLLAVMVFRLEYTAVRPIVEAMGLDWGGQQQKLSKSGNKFGCRDMLCLQMADYKR